jgi:hypothetical protein
MNLPADPELWFVEERLAIVALLEAMSGDKADSQAVADIARSILDRPEAFSALVLLGTLALEGLEAIVAGSDLTAEDWLWTTGLELAMATA